MRHDRLAACPPVYQPFCLCYRDLSSRFALLCFALTWNNQTRLLSHDLLQELKLEACTLVYLRLECPQLRVLALPHSKLMGIVGSLPKLTSLSLSGKHPLSATQLERVLALPHSELMGIVGTLPGHTSVRLLSLRSACLLSAYSPRWSSYMSVYVISRMEAWGQRFAVASLQSTLFWCVQRAL